MSEHENIKEIILEHIGKKNGIRSPKLAKIIGVDPGGSNVNIRRLILETIRIYSLPIGSHTYYGYYLIENKDELKEYIRSLDSRRHEIDQRKVLVNVAYYRHNEGEELELTEEKFDFKEQTDEDFEEEGDTLDI